MNHDAPRSLPAAQRSGLTGRTVAAVALPTVAAGAVASVAPWPRSARLAVVVGGAALAVVTTMRAVVAPSSTERRHAHQRADALELELLAEREFQDFRDRFERALRLSETESTTLRTGLRAVAELVPDGDVSLLLNVPDEPRIGWRVHLRDGNLEPAVPVPGTPTCTALADGHRVVTLISSRLDACAHLQDPDVETSAVCVPMQLGERTMGALCLLGAPGERPGERTMEQIEWVVERTGMRAGEQRLQRGPSQSGPADPITGLPGPATLRAHLREMVRTLTPFCVSVIGIDDHGELIDQGAGAESMRLLADVLSSALRPDDLVVALGGARFAAVLTQCTGEQATAAVERAREALVLAIAETSQAPFTFSAGLVESHRASSLDELVEVAAAGCGAARDRGGNRVVNAAAELPVS